MTQQLDSFFPLTVDTAGRLAFMNDNGTVLVASHASAQDLHRIAKAANFGYAEALRQKKEPNRDFKNVTSLDVAVLLETLHGMYEFTEQVAPTGDDATAADHIIRADLRQQMREWLSIYASLSTTGYVEILELLYKCSSLNHYEVIRDTSDILAAKRKAYDLAYRSPDEA